VATPEQTSSKGAFTMDDDIDNDLPDYAREKPAD
jgi:hypothetical protein